MIIKLCTTSDVLHIIENAKNVQILLGAYFAYKIDQINDIDHGVPIETYSEKFSEAGFPVYYRLIDYDDQFNTRHRIAVFDAAYICDDAGKTIETVNVDSGAKSRYESLIKPEVRKSMEKALKCKEN